MDNEIDYEKYPSLKPNNFTIEDKTAIFDNFIAEYEYYGEWKSSNMIFYISTRKNFSPIKEDIWYPKIRENESLQKFYLRCEKHEKLFFSENFAQYEKNVKTGIKCEKLNTQYLCELINIGYCWSPNAYIWTITCFHNDILEKMLIKGQDPDECFDEDNWTQLLFVSAFDGIKENIDTIKLLLEYGADPDRRGYRYNTISMDEDDEFLSFRDNLLKCEQEIQDEYKFYMNIPKGISIKKSIR